MPSESLCFLKVALFVICVQNNFENESLGESLLIPLGTVCMN